MTWNKDHTRKGGGRWRCAVMLNERRQLWREANPEKERLASRKSAKAWQKANPDRRREQCRLFRERHLEAERERLRLWKHNHPDKVCNDARIRRARRAGVLSDGHSRLEVFQRDGGICQICGTDLDPRAWHEDHIVPIVAGGADTLANVQATCPPCNMQKGSRVA